MSPPLPLRPALIAAAGYKSSYVPKTPDEIKLNHNESALDVDPATKSAILAKLLEEPWHRYDDPDGLRLRHALARATGWPEAGIALGHGANELVQRLMWALDSRSVVVTPSPDYYVYTRAAQVAGLTVRSLPLLHEGAHFSLDIEGLLQAPQGQPAALFLSWPNNPTGCLFDRGQILQLAQRFAGLVIVDEAYFAYSHATLQPELPSLPNLVLLRTLAKAEALAGVRLGYLLANVDLVSELNKLSPPYPHGILETVAAEVVLAQGERTQARVAETLAQRQAMAEALRLMGIESLESSGNFLLLHLGDEQPAALEALAQAHIAVRDLGRVGQWHGCLRLSVGTPVANARAVAALASLFPA